MGLQRADGLLHPWGSVPPELAHYLAHGFRLLAVVPDQLAQGGIGAGKRVFRSDRGVAWVAVGLLAQRELQPPLVPLEEISGYFGVKPGLPSAFSPSVNSSRPSFLSKKLRKRVRRIPGPPVEP